MAFLHFFGCGGKETNNIYFVFRFCWGKETKIPVFCFFGFGERKRKGSGVWSDTRAPE